MRDANLLPSAPILMESTRSIGYSFEAALADIIDNSISNMAKHIEVLFDSNTPQYIAIIDDGEGMTENELIASMRYGSQSASEEREKDDLGRFGLGLKTASMSQCRKLTVISKKDNEKTAVCWDLDHVTDTGEWSLICYSFNEINNLKFSEKLDLKCSGTIVLWEKFDRMLSGAADTIKNFDEKIDLAKEHMSLVFHRFLKPDSEDIEKNNKSLKIVISFNGVPLKAIDPFLTENNGTQILEETELIVHDIPIYVKPYTLPFISKITDKEKRSLGKLAELRNSQGFYVYRNYRLIIWGTWFRLIGQNELSKLTRVRVDIPNSLDSIWDIDIKKSKASLPEIIKKNLVDIVIRSVGRSESVFRYRGRKKDKKDGLIHVWDIVDNRGSFKYVVNREIPLYKMILAQLDEKGQRCFNSFLDMLEDTFPYGDVYLRQVDNQKSAQSQNLEEEKVYDAAYFIIESLKSIGGDIKAFINSIDSIDFFKKYPNVVEDIRKEFLDDK